MLSVSNPDFFVFFMNQKIFRICRSRHMESLEVHDFVHPVVVCHPYGWAHCGFLSTPWFDGKKSHHFSG